MGLGLRAWGLPTEKDHETKKLGLLSGQLDLQRVITPIKIRRALLTKSHDPPSRPDDVVPLFVQVPKFVIEVIKKALNPKPMAFWSLGRSCFGASARASSPGKPRPETWKVWGLGFRV